MGGSGDKLLVFASESVYSIRPTSVHRCTVVVLFLPVVLVTHKDQGPALFRVVEGGVDLLDLPGQTEAAQALGEAAHQVVAREGPDLTTWRHTGGKDTGLARGGSLLLLFQVL